MRADLSARLLPPILASLPLLAALGRGGVTPTALFLLQIAPFLLLAAVLFLGRSPRAWRPHESAGELLLATLLPWGAVSWLWSAYRGRSREEAALWIALALYYGLCRTWLRDERALRRFAWTLVVGGSTMALLAVLLTGGGLLGVETFARRTGYWASLTFVNHNHFAGFVGPIALLAAGLALASGPALRVVAWVLAGTSAAAVAVSLSRGGLLSLCLAAAFLLIAFRLAGSRRRSLRLTAALGVLALALLFSDWQPVRERLGTLADLHESSANRPEMWRATLGMIEDHPFLGSGLGTYASRWPLYQDGASKPTHHAHSDYLELAAELGLPALALLILAIGALLAGSLPRLLRRRSPSLQGIGLGALAAFVYVLLHSLLDFNTHIPSNAMLYLACLALALGAAQAGPSPERSSPVAAKGGSRWLRPRFLVGTTLGLAFSAAAFLHWLSQRELARGQLLFWESRFDVAADSFRRSLRYGPDRAEPAAALGDACLAMPPQERVDDCLAAYERAVAACPDCLDIGLGYAHALEVEGEPARAERVFEEVSRSAPRHPSPSLQRGLFLLRRGRAREASPWLRRALFLAGDRQETFDQVFREVERMRGVGDIVDVLPTGVGATLRYARYLESRQAYALAAQQWEVVVARDPSPEHVRSHLRALARGEDDAAALRHARRYASLYQNDTSLLLLAASILARSEDREPATELLEQILRSEADNVEARVQLARLRCALGEAAAGSELLAAGLDEDPFEARLLMADAICNLQGQSYERALERAKEASELAPENPDAFATLGQVYFGLRLDQQAADAWRRCLELAPFHPACTARLSRLLRRLER